MPLLNSLYTPCNTVRYAVCFAGDDIELRISAHDQLTSFGLAYHYELGVPVSCFRKPCQYFHSARWTFIVDWVRWLRKTLGLVLFKFVLLLIIEMKGTTRIQYFSENNDGVDPGCVCFRFCCPWPTNWSHVTFGFFVETTGNRLKDKFKFKFCKPDS